MNLFLAAIMRLFLRRPCDTAPPPKPAPVPEGDVQRDKRKRP